jgi:hypothetical protein
LKLKLVCIETSAFSLTGLTDFVIPSSIESFCESCLFQCESLSSVRFESKSQLVRIGASAFYMSGLTDVLFHR